jgi:peptide/nickel transport system ATP-binding protein
VTVASTYGEPSTGALLEVRDLRVAFDTPAGEVVAVDGVSLDVHRGRTVAVVGESGSGKTVLSRSVLRLLTAPNLRPAEGEVRFDDEDLLAASRRRLRRLWGDEVAVVFQDPMTSLNPTMRIGRQLTEGMRLHRRISRSDATARAVALLEEVGIPDPAGRLRRYPHELSGGMRQRVTIAIALACDPRLLIADEPTTALDVTVQAQILDLLDTARRDRDMGLVLISHDLGVVEGRSDEVVVMYAGRVVERAPTRRVFAQPAHPYTTALIGSTPRLDAPSHSRLAAIPGTPPDPRHRPAGCRFAPRCVAARARCLDEDPPLLPTHVTGGLSACFHPPGTREGQEAVDANVAAGRTAAGLPVDDHPSAEVR